MQHVRAHRIRAALLAALALFLLIPAAAVTATAAGAVSTCATTWKHPGTSGDFSVRRNWTNGVPGAAKGACLPADATPYTVTELAGARARSLTVGGGATLHLESNTSAGTVALVVGIGGILNSGTIELVNSDSTPRSTTLVVDGASLENDGAVRLLPSSGTQVIDAPVHDGATGTLDAQTDAQVTQLDNDGDVSVAGGATLALSALANFDASTHTLTRGQFDVAGVLTFPKARVVTLDAGLSLDGSAAVRNPATNADALAGLATVTANGTLSVNDGDRITTAALTNHGRVLIGSTSSITTTGNYTEAGVYTSLAPISELIATHSGTVTITTGSIVGSGAIEAPVVNEQGTVYAAPQLLFTSNYTQQPGATLSMRVGDSNGNGRVTVNGTAVLGGTLAVTAADGLMTQTGDRYELLNAAALAGTFAHFTTGGLTGAYGFEPVYDGTTVSAEVVDGFDDTDPAVAYDGWSGQGAGGTGTSLRYACDGNETATFAFTGSKVVWNTARGTEMGEAQVLVDGASKGTFDLYAPTNAPYSLSFPGLGAGAHTIVVKTLGDHNVQSTDTCVVVDSFTVGAVVTQETARTITWSNWTGVTAGAGGYRTASATNAIVRFTGTMDGVEWVTRTGPDQGEAQVVVDGLVVESVDLYAANVHTDVRVFVPTSDDSHTVAIVVTGSKNSKSTGTAVAVDGFVVHGPPTTVV